MEDRTGAWIMSGSADKESQNEMLSEPDRLDAPDVDYEEQAADVPIRGTDIQQTRTVTKRLSPFQETQNMLPMPRCVQRF
ncbi:hypothetical protein KOW79_001097 [Hemibagrus wyckioides]|uniref:Uncharacterized protein n=1 Tax=Hemibagrus wyckioides TaxID=337641 RepID=A0A9D3PAC4_9TELE|nr:hypothetical protein KOW79_001097 [Hemibagrus wyckioides]